MNTALSEFHRLPQNKKELNSFFVAAKNEILNGYTDLIQLKIQMKIFSDLLKKLNDDKEIKNAICNEVANSDQEKIKYQERTKWDFSVCNDSELEELLEYEKKVKAAIIERKDFLKGIDPNNDLNNERPIVNEETGEIINAPAKGCIKVLTVNL